MASVQVKTSKGEYLIHGFVFVNQEKQMYGVREITSQEGRVWYGLPSIKDLALLRQFGLQVENISHQELSARLENQRQSLLKREENRMQRLQAALLVASDSYLSTNFGDRASVESKIKSCQEKINNLKRSEQQ